MPLLHMVIMPQQAIVWGKDKVLFWAEK